MHRNVFTTSMVLLQNINLKKVRRVTDRNEEVRKKRKLTSL